MTNGRSLGTTWMVPSRSIATSQCWMLRSWRESWIPWSGLALDKVYWGGETEISVCSALNSGSLQRGIAIVAWTYFKRNIPASKKQTVCSDGDTVIQLHMIKTSGNFHLEISGSDWKATAWFQSWGQGMRYDVIYGGLVREFATCTALQGCDGEESW